LQDWYGDDGFFRDFDGHWFRRPDRSIDCDSSPAGGPCRSDEGENSPEHARKNPLKKRNEGHGSSFRDRQRAFETPTAPSRKSTPQHPNNQKNRQGFPKSRIFTRENVF